MPPPWFFSLVPRDGIEPPQAQGFNLPLSLKNLLWCAVTPKGQGHVWHCRIAFTEYCVFYLVPSVSCVLETYHTTHYLH